LTRFVVLLRGINVGGHIVKKETLQEVFKSLGFENVSTFKQSGNIVFDSDLADDEVEAKVTSRLKAKLGFEVAVFARTIQHLKAIVDLNAFKGQKEEGSSFLVTFLYDQPLEAFSLQLPLTIPKSTAQVISAEGREIFSVTHGGGEGALPNPFVESKLKVQATTRNINVLKEIVEKYSA
jgi:uncharacterized protein (DUF1697 family)